MSFVTHYLKMIMKVKVCVAEDEKYINCIKYIFVLFNSNYTEFIKISRKTLFS